MIGKNFRVEADRILKIMDEDWDYLIILDACRYDYFKNLSEDYFSGGLEKRISPATGTLEWCIQSFPSYYAQVIYISGNPHINSKVEVAGFEAKKHFAKIVDVWESGWDERLGTVPPRNMNKAALRSIDRFPEKRFIIHYMQPHAPYISKKFFLQGFPTPFTEGPLAGCQGYRSNGSVERLVNLLGILLLKSRVIRNTWELRQMLRLPPASPMDAARRKHGVRGLRQAYRENLSITLAYAAKLCRAILEHRSSSKIVITADHGEFLGEDGRYSHGQRNREPILVEVPWFRVKGVKRASYTAQASEEFSLPAIDGYKEKIEGKIRELKESGKL